MTHGYSLSRFLSLVLFSLIVSGCNIFPSESINCKKVDPWVDAIEVLTEGNYEYNPHIFTPKRIYRAIYPAFSDDIFTKHFGKPYFDLSKKERDHIFNALSKCNQKWAYVGLGFPFQAHEEGRFEDIQKNWDFYLNKAKSTSYAKAIKQKKFKEIANKKILEKNASRKIILEREARERSIRLNKESIANAQRKKQERINKFSQYGSCAPKLEERLATCSVDTRCDMTQVDCYNITSCNKHMLWTGKCVVTLNTKGRSGKTYFCDINTGNSNINREKIIAKICK
jgi:hypothetical protein